MALTEKIIAIIELCVYIPILPLTLIVVFRHGFRKQLGWIYLAILCAIRIAGAVFKLLSDANPDNSTDAEWAYILQSVGLSPLLMASLGLLKRITDQVSDHVSDPESGMNIAVQNMMQSSRIAQKIGGRANAISRRSRIIQLLQIPTMIALILCVVGGIDQASSDVTEHPTGVTDTKIGVIMFLVVYVILFLLAVFTIKDVGNAPRGEKRVYFVVIMALPLIAVRLLYSILTTFTHLSGFTLQDPNEVVQLCMAIVEEIVVVVMYLLAGLTIQR